MRLAEVLREENILSDLHAREKQELLEEMVGTIASADAGFESDKVLHALVDRERLGTTGIGHGVAIPHGKVKGLGEIRVYFGRSRKGVNFDSLDNMPVHLFFMIIAPENSAAAHLKILASISHLLKNQDLRTSLLKADTRSEMHKLINEAERKHGIM